MHGCGMELMTALWLEDRFCNLQVTSGGPILGVSSGASSGTQSFGAFSLAAVCGMAVMALCFLG